MSRDWPTYLKEGNTFVGLEIGEVGDTLSYGILEVKKNKGELTISSSLRVTEIGNIRGHIKKDVPVLLAINTPSILTKITSGVEDGVPEALVNGAFPNLDLDNFYYQISQRYERPIITIAKKEYIDGILERMGRQNISIANISLGIGTLESILPYTRAPGIYAFNARIAVEDNLISKSSVESVAYNEDYSINGLEVNSAHLLGFSHIVAFLGRNIGATNLSEANRALGRDLHNRRIFNFGLRYALLFLTLLLLFNFLLFAHYRGKVEYLAPLVASNAAQRGSLIELEATVARKKERFGALTASSISKATYYLDGLAKDLPATVLLDGIRYQPLAGQVRGSKPIALTENTILVSGVSRDDGHFSDWLENLESQDWVQGVVTTDYDFMTDESSNFSIKIALHEN